MEKYGVLDHIKKRWATNNTSTIGTTVGHADTFPIVMPPPNA